MPPKVKPTTPKTPPTTLPPAPPVNPPANVNPAPADPFLASLASPPKQSYLAPVTNGNVKQVLSGIELPEYLQQLDTLPDTQPKAEYIGFASNRSKQWVTMANAGCQEGQPFLFTNGQYIALPNGLNGHLIDVRKFYTTMEGQDGIITKVTVEDTGENNHEVHYLAFWLAKLPNGAFAPIRGDFRRTKAGGFEQSLTALKMAASPEWLNLSDAHKVSAIFPQPWGRVIHAITTSREVSKSTMNVYYRTQCNSRPSNMDDITRLTNALRDSDFIERMNAQYTQFLRRNDYYHSLIKKPNAEVAK